METDPTTMARLALKRPHDANSGDTPAPKRVQISRNPTPDPDSEDDPQQSPTLNASRRRKSTPATAATKRTHNKTTPQPLLPPMFLRNTPTVTPPSLNIQLPPAFEFTLPADPETTKDTLPPAQNIATNPQSPSLDENDIKATFESLCEEWVDNPNPTTADMSKIFGTRPTSLMAATAPNLPTTEKEWALVQTNTKSPHLDHHSDNPFDFLTVSKLDSLIRLWKNEKMEDNELTKNEKMFLGTPKIKKILAKVVSQGSPPIEDERRNMWLRAAVLSAMATPKTL